jgi:hypothetical protein
MINKIKKLCGGANTYVSIRVQSNSDGEMTTTIRKNYQEIANGNSTMEQYGYMFGKWLMNKTSVYFVNGVFKAFKEQL